MEETTPPTPGSYIWPLLGMIVLCGGYLWYSRARRRDASFELRDVLKYRPAGMGGNDGVRLSIDDMPSRTEFLSNNASTDSLPEGVELPTFHSHRTNNRSPANSHPSYITDPAPQTNHSHPSPFLDNPLPAHSKAASVLGLGGGKGRLGVGFGRRSMRRKSPIEGDSGSDEDETDEEEHDGRDGTEGSAGSRPVFGIGDEEDIDRS